MSRLIWTTSITNPSRDRNLVLAVTMQQYCIVFFLPALPDGSKHLKLQNPSTVLSIYIYICTELSSRMMMMMMMMMNFSLTRTLDSCTSNHPSLTLHFRWMEANEVQRSALDSCTSRPSFMRRARI